MGSRGRADRAVVAARLGRAHEALYVMLSGRLRIEMEGSTVELGGGDAFVVPRGARHDPVADEECHIMLIERKTTRHTGSETTGRTRSIADPLRPL